MQAEKDEHFEIELFDPEGGVKIGQINRTAVTITNDDGNYQKCLLYYHKVYTLIKKN